MRGPKVDLKLTVLPSCLRVTVLGRPPLPEETPGVIAVVGVEGVRRRIWHRGGIRCSIGGLIGPERKWMKAIIQDKPINKLEKFIAMSRRCRSYLIRRRRWLIGRFSSRTSSAVCLPWLSSPAMDFVWIYGEEEETTTGFEKIEDARK